MLRNIRTFLLETVFYLEREILLVLSHNLHYPIISLPELLKWVTVLFYMADGAILCYFPIVNVAFFYIKIDSCFHDRFATKGEALVVLLEIDLLQCSFCILVELQFY